MSDVSCRVGLMGAPDVDDSGMGKAREAACDREVALAACKGHPASKLVADFDTIQQQAKGDKCRQGIVTDVIYECPFTEMSKKVKG